MDFKIVLLKDTPHHKKGDKISYDDFCKVYYNLYCTTRGITKEKLIEILSKKIVLTNPSELTDIFSLSLPSSFEFDGLFFVNKDSLNYSIWNNREEFTKSILSRNREACLGTIPLSLAITLFNLKN